MALSDQHLTLPDGRRLRYRSAGDPSGPLVVHHHGTPSSGALLPDWQADAERQGLHLVGVDRSGYAGSTADPGRRMREVVADTLALADHLGAGRFLTWGISGGGPHALACAALAPDRVTAAASVGGPAPYDAAGLDYTAGMGEGNVAEFAAAAEGGSSLRELLERERETLLADRDEGLDSLLAAPDRTFLETPAAAGLLAAMPEGLEPGVQG